jgi:hypothetical protein
MEYYSAIKKNNIISFAGKLMELENITLSKISQAQKVKYPMLLFTCETKPKMVMIIIIMIKIGSECIWETGGQGERKGKGMRGEEDGSTPHTYTRRQHNETQLTVWKRGRGVRNAVEGELVQSTLYAGTELSQRSPLVLLMSANSKLK